MAVTLDDVRIVAAQVLKPEAVDYWLAIPNELLEGRSPAYCVGLGEGDRVLAVLDAIATGAYL